MESPRIDVIGPAMLCALGSYVFGLVVVWWIQNRYTAEERARTGALVLLVVPCAVGLSGFALQFALNGDYGESIATIVGGLLLILMGYRQSKNLLITRERSRMNADARPMPLAQKTLLILFDLGLAAYFVWRGVN